MSSTPSTSELVALGAPAVLRDGSRVRLRQIRSSDKELLRRGFERLSEESRYRRFQAPMPALNEAAVRYLTEVDHHDHEAIVALDDATGEGVGVARYIRSRERPEAAEAAVTVIDDWQRRGVGTLLLEVLGARARQEQITTFTALMLASNHEMMDLLESLSPVRIVDREAGTVEIEAPIPEVGLSPVVRKLLRVAARTDLAVPLAGRPGQRALQAAAARADAASAMTGNHPSRSEWSLSGSTIVRRPGHWHERPRAPWPAVRRTTNPIGGQTRMAGPARCPTLRS